MLHLRRTFCYVPVHTGRSEGTISDGDGFFRTWF